MRDKVIHRGPSRIEVWVDGTARVAFDRRRLVIIELSDAALQPMSFSDGDLSIFFYSEIYNHTELRQELIEFGHTNWKVDHSRSEVILRAFRQWGIECLMRFHSVFAIALWGARDDSLWLVRDRLGIKLLYDVRGESGVVFATEIIAIMARPKRLCVVIDHV